MSREAFKARTKAYALRVIRLVDALPSDRTARTIGQQLLRSGMSVAANYRAAVRGRSTADFIAKMGIVEEECDESLLWMEVLIDCGRVRPRRIEDLMKEGHEILAITVASIKTARRGRDAFK
jgi:four helix bundle protein